MAVRLRRPPVDQVTVESLQNVVHEGYLLKRSDFFRMWNKRWCVLKDKRLYYFGSRAPGERPKGAVNLDGYLVELVEDSELQDNLLSRKGAGITLFRLYHATAPDYMFCAWSEPDLEEWVQSFLVESFREYTRQTIVADFQLLDVPPDAAPPPRVFAPLPRSPLPTHHDAPGSPLKSPAAVIVSEDDADEADAVVEAASFAPPTGAAPAKPARRLPPTPLSASASSPAPQSPRADGNAGAVHVESTNARKKKFRPSVAAASPASPSGGPDETPPSSAAAQAPPPSLPKQSSQTALSPPRAAPAATAAPSPAPIAAPSPAAAVTVAPAKPHVALAKPAPLVEQPQPQSAAAPAKQPQSTAAQPAAAAATAAAPVSGRSSENDTATAVPRGAVSAAAAALFGGGAPPSAPQKRASAAAPTRSAAAEPTAPPLRVDTRRTTIAAVSAPSAPPRALPEPPAPLAPRAQSEPRAQPEPSAASRAQPEPSAASRAQSEPLVPPRPQADHRAAVPAASQAAAPTSSAPTKPASQTPSAVAPAPKAAATTVRGGDGRITVVTKPPSASAAPRSRTFELPPAALASPTAACVEWVNVALAGNPSMTGARALPLTAARLGDACKDGILLCALVNAVASNTLDERAVTTAGLDSAAARADNVRLALTSARSVGCQMGAVDAARIAAGDAAAAQSAVWAMLRVALRNRLPVQYVADDASAAERLPPCALCGCAVEDGYAVRGGVVACVACLGDTTKLVRLFVGAAPAAATTAAADTAAPRGRAAPPPSSTPSSSGAVDGAAAALHARLDAIDAKCRTLSDKEIVGGQGAQMMAEMKSIMAAIQAASQQSPADGIALVRRYNELAKTVPARVNQANKAAGAAQVVVTSKGSACAKCGQALQGDIVEAFGSSFHKACFGCTTCNMKLASTCLNIDGKPYCDRCGKKAFIAQRMGNRRAAV